jgi:hypothetical protein
MYPVRHFNVYLGQIELRSITMKGVRGIYPRDETQSKPTRKADPCEDRPEGHGCLVF